MSRLQPAKDWLTGRRTPDVVLWPAVFGAIGMTAVVNLVNIGMLDVHPVPDLLHPATPTTLRDTLAAMSPDSRRGYLLAAWLDWIYPAVYAVGLSGLLARTTPERVRFLSAMPVVAAAFDLVENTFFIAMLGQGGEPATWALRAASGANTVKWLFADLSLLSVLLFGGAYAVRRIGRDHEPD